MDVLVLKLRGLLFLSRYVIECPNCGVIYRSRQYWYGNQDPVETVVRTEIQHIWPGVNPKWKDLNEILLKRVGKLKIKAKSSKPPSKKVHFSFSVRI